MSEHKVLGFENPTNEDLLTALRVCGDDTKGCRVCPLFKSKPCSNLFGVVADRIAQQAKQIEFLQSERPEPESQQPLQRRFALACRILADGTGLCPQNIFETGWEECMGEAEKCGDHDIWKCWQKFINETVEVERVCRVCGCTENNACFGRDNAQECCSWIEEDLCSACATEPEGAEKG